jgi:N-acetylated-alpha-linked acidic dipeptidase
MPRIARGVSVLVAIAATGHSACARSDSLPVPFGFSPASGGSHLALEAKFLGLPDAVRIRDAHRLLTLQPHPAGSPRDRELADWTAQQFRSAGLDDVQITTHEVLVSEPLDVTVDMVLPKVWRASMRELPVDGDSDTAIAPAVAGLPHYAYSASGQVTAPVVYAGYGTAADYEWLARQGIDVRDRIVVVRHSGPQRYRGAAVWAAEQRGAAGILMYPDPRDEPQGKSKPYPDAIVAESRIERGSVAYDFLVPGDPLTPGWPSVAGAKRIDRRFATALPKIPSLPLSIADVRPILQSLGGVAVPDWLRSGLVPDLRAGPGPALVRMKVTLGEHIRPIWTVTGMLHGSSSTGEVVIVGNHRDAWIYGGVDPATGSAALVELARAFGELHRGGWRPKRSIVFASWDAEELALTSSTEWAEQHEEWLRDHAVAYLNVDSAASGLRFVAGAAPSLMRVIAAAADAVRDPASRVSIAATARSRWSMDRGAPLRGVDIEVVEDRLGGGSDYTVFLNHLGVPAADLAFDGPLPVYHSVHDTHEFVARVADPEFRYTTTLVKVLGIAALRLLDGDAIPLDVQAAAAIIQKYIAETSERLAAGGSETIVDVGKAADELEQAAAAFSAARDAAIAAADGPRLAELNRRALAFERAFIDPPGLTGRPWFRHLLLAPDRTYAPRVLPGITDAIDRGDSERIVAEAARLARALRRAAASLR